jgi:hypothetical protein
MKRNTPSFVPTRLQYRIPYVAIMAICILLHNCSRKNDSDIPPAATTITSSSVQPGFDTCLPPATMQGRHTFGCKVNGKNWLPEGGWFSPGVYASFGRSRTLDFWGEHAAKRESITINIGQVTDTGYYTFPDDRFLICKATYIKLDAEGKEYVFSYRADKIDNGYLHLTRLDLSATGFISGTFAFDLYQENFRDTVHITDGRFDIRF